MRTSASSDSEHGSYLDYRTNLAQAKKSLASDEPVNVTEPVTHATSPLSMKSSHSSSLETSDTESRPMSPYLNYRQSLSQRLLLMQKQQLSLLQQQSPSISSATSLLPIERIDDSSSIQPMAVVDSGGDEDGKEEETMDDLENQLLGYLAKSTAGSTNFKTNSIDAGEALDLDNGEDIPDSSKSRQQNNPPSLTPTSVETTTSPAHELQGDETQRTPQEQPRTELARDQTMENMKPNGRHELEENDEQQTSKTCFRAPDMSLQAKVVERGRKVKQHLDEWSYHCHEGRWIWWILLFAAVIGLPLGIGLGVVSRNQSNGS